MVSHFVRKPAIDFGNPAHTTSDVSRGSSKRSPLELKRLTKCRPRIERYALPWARTSRPDEGRFFTSIPLGVEPPRCASCSRRPVSERPGGIPPPRLYSTAANTLASNGFGSWLDGIFADPEVTGVFRSLACKSATPFRNCIVVPEALYKAHPLTRK